MIEVKTRELDSFDELWEIFLWFRENSPENVEREEMYYADASPPDRDPELNRLSLEERFRIIKEYASFTERDTFRYIALFTDRDVAAQFKLLWG